MKTLLTTREAAEYMGISPATLALWRNGANPTGPKIVRLGPSLIRYSPSDLDAFLEQQVCNPGENKSCADD